ncbi:hypothetical protein A4A49_12083 [Nicotiana attenuata]|uniref:Uncharacterized protein n=1 Tax=Nicotiana attenuata TaxID=49451 RepID=A0A1J6IKJ4_NICAT|nr:hypothetical protein A4A49_12083 [Nicotiana attenuata]
MSRVKNYYPTNQYPMTFPPQIRLTQVSPESTTPHSSPANNIIINPIPSSAPQPPSPLNWLHNNPNQNTNAQSKNPMVLRSQTGHLKPKAHHTTFAALTTPTLSRGSKTPNLASSKVRGNRCLNDQWDMGFGIKITSHKCDRLQVELTHQDQTGWIS